jgi:NodT family efflux transporter outer membrane factor (OMF) lipoprotein
MSDQAVRIVSHCVWFFLIALSFTAGCVVGPNFERPVGPAVTSYDAAPVSLPALGGPDPVQRFIDDGAIARQWWELFRSPALNEVLVLAIKGSPTLASARATLAQAEEVVVAARGAYYPQVDLAATGNYQYNRSLNRESPVSNSVAASGKNSLVTSMFDIGPLITYTPDLFGLNRRLVEEDVALAENQRYQLAAAYLTLTADSVTQAVTISSTVAQIDAVNDIIAVDEHNLDLVRIAFAAGSVARTDVLSAESQLANDRTLLPPLGQQLSVAQHALSVLVGKTPAEWSPPPFDLEMLTLPGELPVTVPSQLVHERPDILSAEAQLHAVSAAIGVATAQLYPSVTLSPSWTLQTATIEGRFAGPDIAAEMAGAIAAPIFHGGTLKALQRAAVDAYEGELNVYRQTVLQAFGQVADVLRALQHDTELLGAESTAATASKASLDLSQAAYAAGRGSLVQVLDAQRLYAQALQGYAHAKGQRYLDSVLLFEAMGGDSKAWIESNAGSQH